MGKLKSFVWEVLFKNPQVLEEKLQELAGAIERGLLGFLPTPQLLHLGQTPAEGGHCTAETFLDHLSAWPAPAELGVLGACVFVWTLIIKDLV